MSLAWMGRRVARYLVACGLLAALVYALTKPEPPRVGYATAVAGVPVNKTAPPITGDPRLGGTLTCGPGTWDQPATFTTQWVRDNQDLTGETATTHTVTAADVGRNLRCDVRATNADGASTRASSITYVPPAPSALTPPRITGDLRLGRTLSCSRGTWNDDGVPTYPTTTQWLRSNDPIAGQTGDTYTITPADMGRTIGCRVSVLGLASSNATALSPTAPAIRSLPAVTGDPRLGGTLTCSRGVWDDEGITPYPVTKQWLRGSAEILGATGDEYTVRLADLEQSISCRVRAADLTNATSLTVTPTSPAQRSQPAIEGDPRLGRTLSCTRGTWDDAGRDGEYAVSYEWFRAGVLIGPGQTHTVTALDVDKALRCTVTVEGKTAVNSPNVTAVGPRALTVPTLSGDARLGRTLSCSRGVWDDPATPYAVTYQWLRAGAAIAGATDATYAPTTADVGRALSCRVTAAGFTNATSSSVTVQGPEAFLPPRIEGDPRVGSTLSCTRGNWDDPPGEDAVPYAVTYQWYRGNTAIAGATNATYVPQTGDSSINCRVTASGTTSQSASVSLTTAATGGTPVNLIAPAISGDRRVGRTLTCSRGSWNDATPPFPVTYRWRRGTVAIVGATEPTYTITADDLGQSLNCQVIANGTTTATSPSYTPTPPEVIMAPAISGDPRVRQTLSCSRGAWHEDNLAPYPITYRWLRNSTAIPNATASTYTVTEADLDTSLTCEVRAAGQTTSTSTAVTATSPRAVLAPVVSGEPRLRRTLTCARGTWDDLATDRYAVTHQWLRDNVAIPGETNATFALTAADTGRAISCQTRAETRTPTAPLNGAQTVRAPLNRLVPRLSGVARVRQTLSCTRGDWDDDAADRYSVAYRWFRGSNPIPGETEPTYTVTSADIAQAIHCRVRAEDLTEAQSAAITIRRPANVVAPTISGDPRLFRTVTCSRGDWDDLPEDRYSVTYSWLRSGTVIPGAVGPTYTVAHEDMSKTLACRVRAEDNVDATSATVSTELPRAILPPQVTGRPHLRGELSCTRGTWDDTPERRYSVSYQWYRSGTPILAATDPTYVIGTADLNKTLTCRATAEVLRDSASAGLYVDGPYDTVLPTIQGIAHPRRELSCTRGEWNDSPENPYVLTYQWRRGGRAIQGADGPHHIVVAEDVGTYLQCAVTAEGAHVAVSPSIYPSWEPLRLSLLPDNDAIAPNAFNAYTLRVRNDNPVPVVITQLDLTMPGGFSYRPGTTSGAQTTDPQLTGPGSLTLRWTADFTVPALGESVVRVGVMAGSALGDFLASARATPTSSAFTTPSADRTARITVEGAEPAGGACTIVGTPGDDVLVGTPGPDVICGLGGDDLIQGLGGDDEIWGGPGDDRLEGGDGDDVLRGGDGADVLDGEAGADVLRGGGGLDTVTYAARVNPVNVTVGVTEGDDGEAGEGDTVSSDVEIIRGGRGDDTLIGGPGPEELYGRGGDDTIDGGDGEGDLLDGGDGNDTLSDDDRMNDRVFCGGGWDRYNADLLDRVVGCEESFSIVGGLR